jgi:glycosyltransferase involved in cell wall biosynthesis
VLPAFVITRTRRVYSPTPVHKRISVPSAIVHDWFQGYHGSERVVETIRAEVFEETTPPDIYTFHAAHELLPRDLSNAIVQESRLSRLPGIRQRGHDPGRWRYLLPYMPRYFGHLDLTQYDLVISSSHACAVHVRPCDDALHVCYCYTPMRYAWMSETDRERVSGIKAVVLRPTIERLRRLDLAASQQPDLYVAISTAVQQRIRRFYGRDAVVVHPPVDVDRFTPARGDSEHFLWVHRLVPYKRPQLVVEAFRGLPYRLTMVGVGPLESELKTNLPPNVALLPWIKRDELIRLFERAGGFIHVGEEDFGISMVEALAAGTPVIALDAGGAKDIVRPEQDGVLIADASIEPLREAIRIVASRTFVPDELSARAAAFGRSIFVERLCAELERLLASAGRPTWKTA